MQPAPTRSERRAWPRCRNQLPVLVSDPGDALEDPYPACIVDRSRGGLCLLIGPTEIEEGTILGVRPTATAPYAQYIDVRVMNRRRQGKSVHLGCEFVDTASDRKSVV